MASTACAPSCDFRAARILDGSSVPAWSILPVGEIADVYAGVSVRTESEWLSASRPCLFGPDQRRDGAATWRPVVVAHRGYRRGALPAGIRSRHLRGSRLARDRLAA